MSRKTSQTATAPTPGPTKLSAFHVGHEHHRTGKHEHHDQRHGSTPQGAVRAQETDTGSNGDSIESPSSEEEADEEDGDSDRATNEEDEDDEAADPAVKAPSDCAIGDEASQAGVKNGSRMSEHDRAQQTADHTKKTSEDEESSNDEGYGGVDLISDSERDGSDMDSFEERAIIDAEGKNNTSTVRKTEVGRARAQSESSESSWAGFDFGDGGFPDFFDEQFNRTDQDSLLGDPNDILGNGDIFANADFLLDSSPPQRRVRFADPLLEDAPVMPQAPTNTPVCASALPSALTAQGGMGALEGLNYPPLRMTDSDDESGSSSGYETDCGDTTDEDIAPPSATARPQSLMRRPSASMLEESAKAAAKMKPLSQRWGPRMGSWSINPTKPLAIVDSCGKKILVCPARRPKKPDRVFEHILGSASTSANTSPRTQLSTLATPRTNSEFDLSDFSSLAPANPMFGAVPASSFGQLTNGILPSDTDDATFFEDNGLLWGEGDDDDDDDHESGIRMEDLIDFGNYAEDSEPDNTMDDSRPPSSSSTKIGFVSAGQSSSQSFLDHLDTTGVTAFRQTQLPAPATLSPQSPLKKRKLSPSMGEPSKRRLLA